ncbi:NADP-dependent oxidoreductase [Curtobacterium sp. PhB136]|uniref:NADP-dependent oxidoreductase n=1 Tax=Curtobacterium sp. PhB136 TaxID=2485181 RepID=UPI0010DDE726|nr:NADP-dependent oxidoreductase [Curtobacterium sp. PhB136]TCK64252.1 NADPH:quinone reductase-like Zn-dependent oxidoreductase [Curtobacterium sp. PhB136]
MAEEPITTMTAVRAHRRGGPEQLVVEQAPVPELAAGEVLVRVEAAAITVAELTWPETWESGGVDRTPIIPSHEFAGRVARVGGAVEDFHVDDRVFGLVPFDRDGAAAEFVAVPATSVAHRSASVAPTVAAAAVLPALTAWEALVDRAAIGQGTRLLVRGGTGAVGSFLVQIGASSGAEVTATVSSEAAASRARALGAAHVVVVPRGTAPAHIGDFDVAIDAVGDDLPEWVYAAVRPGGDLVVLQQPPAQDVAERYGIRATFFVVDTNQDRLRELDTLLATGRLHVAVAATLPLSAGGEAFVAATAAGRPSGKTLYVLP